MKKIILLLLKVIGFIILFAFLEFLTQPLITFSTNFISNDYVISVIKILLEVSAAVFTVKIFLGKRKLESIGLHRKDINFKTVLFLGLSAVLISSVLTGVIYLLHGYEFQGFIWNKLYIEDIIPFFIVGIIDSLGSSIIDEIPVRGYIYNLLGYKNKYTGVILTAVVYMLLHLLDTGFNLWALLGLIVFSIFLSFIFILTGNLVYNIVFHMFWYFTNAYIYSSPMGGTENPGLIFLQYNNKYLINGGIFGVNASIIFVVLVTILDIILYIRIKHREG